MLFNTQAFVLAFLPAALGLYYAARSHAQRQAVLVGASLAFYGCWDVRFVPALASCDGGRRGGGRRSWGWGWGSR